MYDLQKRIIKRGDKVPLSAAINLCILYFILNAPKYSIDREDSELLLRFIRHGPGVLNRDMPEIESYFKTGIDFDGGDPEDDPDNTTEEESGSSSFDRIRGLIGR
jgi:hypothetical protein